MSAAWLRAAAALGFLGVALGAFGAHGLRDRVSPPLLEVYRTGVLYHLIHATVLLALALGGARFRTARLAAWSFAVGIVLFSGSLYALALTGMSKLGAITPVGGGMFLVGWIALLLGALSNDQKR